MLKEKDAHVSDPERSGEPNATLGGEENLQVLERARELLNPRLGELLPVHPATTADDGVL